MGVVLQCAEYGLKESQDALQHVDSPPFVTGHVFTNNIQLCYPATNSSGEFVHFAGHSIAFLLR